MTKNSSAAHLRLRGADDDVLGYTMSTFGASPPARSGQLRHYPADAAHRRISACAERTISLSLPWPDWRAHLRLRGADPQHGTGEHPVVGASPPARSGQGFIDAMLREDRRISACAERTLWGLRFCGVFALSLSRCVWVCAGCCVASAGLFTVALFAGRLARVVPSGRGVSGGR
ncbi:hypothetical protein [Streptomyces sp. HJ7]